MTLQYQVQAGPGSGRTKCFKTARAIWHCHTFIQHAMIKNKLVCSIMHHCSTSTSREATLEDVNLSPMNHIYFFNIIILLRLCGG